MKHVLVFGVDELSEFGQSIVAELMSRNLDATFIRSWVDWSCSLYPADGIFHLRSHVGANVAIRSRDVVGCLIFDKPMLPQVALEHSTYQAAEYEALLSGLISIAAPHLLLRWKLASAGFSDAAMSIYNLSDHPLLSDRQFSAILDSSCDEVLLIGDNLFLHASNNDVKLVRILPTGPVASSTTPVLVRFVREEARAIPFVGLLPKWLPRAGVWLALSEPSSDLHSTVPNEIHAGATDGAVVIVAHKRDKTSAHLIHNVRSLGREVLFFDVAAIHADEDGSTLSKLGSVVASAGFVFVRAILVETSERILTKQFELLRTLRRCSSLIVNRPGAGFSNASKPAHLLELRNLGFSIPDSVATNCPEDALSFCRTNSDVVFKSCSSERSIATKLVEEEARFALLPNCPVLFQSYLPGPDCRVHTVASETFSLEISCDSIDYRYHEASFERMSLPSSLSEQLVLATRRMGLEIAGADFKKDVSGQWRILEINPMPAFEGFDHHLNQEIVVSLSKTGLLNERAGQGVQGFPCASVPDQMS